MNKPRRSPGSYYHPTEMSQKGMGPAFIGCLRIKGGLIWRCPHVHDFSAEARACAREHLRNHPEVGLDG